MREVRYYWYTWLLIYYDDIRQVFGLGTSGNIWYYPLWFYDIHVSIFLLWWHFIYLYTYLDYIIDLHQFYVALFYPLTRVERKGNTFNISATPWPEQEARVRHTFYKSLDHGQVGRITPYDTSSPQAGGKVEAFWYILDNGQVARLWDTWYMVWWVHAPYSDLLLYCTQKYFRCRSLSLFIFQLCTNLFRCKCYDSSLLLTCFYFSYPASLTYWVHFGMLAPSLFPPCRASTRTHIG